MSFFEPSKSEKCHYSGTYNWYYTDSSIYISDLKFKDDDVDHTVKYVLINDYYTRDSSLHYIYKQNSTEVVDNNRRREKQILRNRRMVCYYTDIDSGCYKRSDTYYWKCRNTNFKDDSTSLMNGIMLDRHNW